MAGPLLPCLLAKSRKTFPKPSPRKVYPCSWFSTSAAAAAVSGGICPSVDPGRLRNVAVIAHVDHGKTTLLERLLRQCGDDIPHERAMDSISLERERVIAIASKASFLLLSIELKGDLGFQIKSVENFWEVWIG